MPLGVETPLSTLNPRLPLLIVDVDEVLGLFVAAFERFIVERGYEMRLERFTLFGSLYRPGEASPLPLETGAALYNAFFHSGVEDMEPTPGAAEALSTLSKGANIVILTNAPDHCRAPRAAGALAATSWHGLSHADQRGRQGGRGRGPGGRRHRPDGLCR